MYGAQDRICCQGVPKLIGLAQDTECRENSNIATNSSLSAMRSRTDATNAVARQWLSGGTTGRTPNAIKPYSETVITHIHGSVAPSVPQPQASRQRHGSVLLVFSMIINVLLTDLSLLPPNRYLSLNVDTVSLRFVDLGVQILGDMQVSPVVLGTNAPPRGPSAPTTARRENSSSAVSPQARSWARSASTPCACVEATSSTVHSVSTPATSHGAASM